MLQTCWRPIPDSAALEALVDAEAFDHFEYGPIEAWDTSRVTSMRGLFTFKTTSNRSLAGWDTSNVTDMAYSPPNLHPQNTALPADPERGLAAPR